jgi:hypothetical protein
MSHGDFDVITGPASQPAARTAAGAFPSVRTRLPKGQT